MQEDTTIKAIAIRGNASSSPLTTSKGNITSEIATFTYTFETRESIASNFLGFTYDSMPYRLYVP
ncbi:hypothetical protein [Neobacillus vireti]|uniref:hypothetical protein n=1 Tax=Neobacillus vireti TaxID=220686 RepID=UPI002FFF0FCA